MKDFTLQTYKNLIQTLKDKNYRFVKVRDYFENGIAKTSSVIIMRHDVDRRPNYSLRMARLENELGVQSTYYFRTVPKTFKPGIINEISDLGHEIGYHYENLSEVHNKNLVLSEDVYDRAFDNFKENLIKLRNIYPVKSIVMHGRPLSNWDNRLLWKKYDYHNFGISSELYLDIDFNEVLYITDASRSWNNGSFNRRDKVNTKYDFQFDHTMDIVDSIDQSSLPARIIINAHPEHWAKTDSEWFRIWLVRKIKNFIKKIIIKNN